MVAGVALLDYDGDGRLDVYAVNGGVLPTAEKTGPEHWNRLFRNDGRGRFTDVTERAGVAGRGYDLGVATGDYDNDGDTDVFVAGLRRNTLFNNNGDGTFKDVTEAAASPGPTRSTARSGRWLPPSWTTTGTAAGPLRLQLLRLGSGARAAVRRSQSTRLLPPETVRGITGLALPQRGQRDLRRRVRVVGHPRARGQGHGDRGGRLRR
jgi:hypothetical protein